MVEHADALCDAVYADLRRAQQVTRAMEVDSTLGVIDECLEQLTDWSAPREVRSGYAEGRTFIYTDPKGVVLNISPFNYPVALSLGMVASIMAAGNTQILKPSDLSVHSSEVLHRMLTSTFPEVSARVSGVLFSDRKTF